MEVNLRTLDCIVCTYTDTVVLCTAKLNAINSKGICWPAQIIVQDKEMYFESFPSSGSTCSKLALLSAVSFKGTAKINSSSISCSCSRNKWVYSSGKHSTTFSFHFLHVSPLHDFFLHFPISIFGSLILPLPAHLLPVWLVRVGYMKAFLFFCTVTWGACCPSRSFLQKARE